MNQGHTAAPTAPELPRLPLNAAALASSLGATSDIDAARLFLEHVGARNERTRREYEREIGRLLLYLDIRRRSLTDATYVDLKEGRQGFM